MSVGCLFIISPLPEHDTDASLEEFVAEGEHIAELDNCHARGARCACELHNLFLHAHLQAAGSLRTST